MSNGARGHTEHSFDTDWFLVPDPAVGEPTVIVGYD